MNQVCRSNAYPETVSGKRSMLQKNIRRCIQSWDLYILLLPAVVYVFIFSYLPMYGVQIAFKDYSTSLGIWGSKWVGLKHFIRFVNYPAFWMIVKNTVIISLYSLATFPCAVLVALLVNELDNQIFKRTVQMISYMPHFISTVVVSGMILLFLNRGSGVVNNVIVLLGLHRIDFMASTGAFYHIVVWSGVWQGLGWGMIIYLAALSGVSPDMIEAARMDGASRLQILLHINVPTIAPTIITMLILRCGSILSVDFQKVLLLQNSLNLDVSQVISTYTYEIGLRGGQFSYSSAIDLFNTVVNFIMLIVVNQICKKTADISIW